MRHGRGPASSSRALVGAQSRVSQPAATCQAVGGVDPGGQLTASGGALRVDAMLGIGQQTLPGSIRPPGATGQGTASQRLKR
jgi:hypothetical protein